MLVALLWLAGCGEREEAVSVQVVAWATPLAAAPGVVVEHGRLVVTAVALAPCETVGAKLWRALSPVSVAWAHAGHTADPSEGFEGGEVMLTVGGSQRLGVLLPAAGRYCQAVLTLAPSATHPSLHAHGEWPVAGASTPFALETRAERVVRLPISLALDDAHRDGALDLELGAVTMPVDLASATAGDELLDAVAASVRAR
ncbi:MAG: hypothetical protein IPJ65_04220 [Archangiaceae bacterium]|nr:hypothetical protein [Archangiaceae bacterium]